MGSKTPVPERDFFRHSLREPINMKHPLVRLTDLINCERSGALMSESFVSGKGRPTSSPRLIALSAAHIRSVRRRGRLAMGGEPVLVGVHR